MLDSDWFANIAKKKQKTLTLTSDNALSVREGGICAITSSFVMTMFWRGNSDFFIQLILSSVSSNII